MYVVYLSHFYISEVSKINICHMVTNSHPWVILGESRVISEGVLGGGWVGTLGVVSVMFFIIMVMVEKLWWLIRYIDKIYYF